MSHPIVAMDETLKTTTRTAQVTVLTPMARLLYSNARSISMEYSEPKMEGDAGDDGLAPIEKLTTTLQAYDLQARVVVAKEVGSMVKRVVDGIDDPMAGQPQYPGPKTDSG